MKSWFIEHYSFTPREDYERLQNLLGQVTYKLFKTNQKLMNAYFCIHPYKRNGIWMFDDELRGILAEPFVGEINAMVDEMLEREEIIPGEPFTAIFGASPFPGYSMKLDHVREESGGNWYHCDRSGKEGWLCPVLFAFFPEAPKNIYIKVVK